MKKKNKKAAGSGSGSNAAGNTGSSGSASKKTENTAVREQKMNIREKFTNLYLLSLFSLFPIFMTKKLFHVRTDRLYFFITATIALLVLTAGAYIFGKDKKHLRTVYQMSVSDWSFIAFTGICLISAIFSSYGEAAFTGSGGRNSGFLLMAVYLLSYFLISRNFRYIEEIFTFFAIMSSVICFIAVLNEFNIDPFALISVISKSQQKDFITTIGNINTFSGFVCVSLPICIIMSVMTKKTVLRIIYLAAAGINMTGLIVGNSLSGYFAFLCVITLLFVYCCKSMEKLFGYFLTLSVLLISIKLLRLFSYIHQDKYKNLSDISKYLVYDNIVYILIIIAAILTATTFLLSKRSEGKELPRYIRYIAGGVVGLAWGALLFIFIYFSFIDTKTDLGSFATVLRLNDKWGTHRGYAWIRSIYLLRSNGLKNFLIGSGPDTFGQMMKASFNADMIKRHGKVFDSAHNEFLHYLVTTGVTGVAAYISLIVTILYRCIKRCKDRIPFLIVIFVIISYCSQSLFNVATPIITPYIFVFLGIAEGLLRNNDAKKAL